MNQALSSLMRIDEMIDQYTIVDSKKTCTKKELEELYLRTGGWFFHRGARLDVKHKRLVGRIYQVWAEEEKT